MVFKLLTRLRRCCSLKKEWFLGTLVVAMGVSKSLAMMTHGRAFHYAERNQISNYQQKIPRLIFCGYDHPESPSHEVDPFYLVVEH